MVTTMVYGKRRIAQMQEGAQQPPVETEKKQKKFSPEANAFFAKMGIKIEELNKLDLSTFPEKNHAYVDYLKPSDMTDGMMSFNNDGREGVALLITGDLIDIVKKTCVKASGVMAIFQRHAFKKNFWVKASHDRIMYQMMDHFKAKHMAEVDINHKHTYDCPSYEAVYIPTHEIQRVVQGEDPEFKIGTPPKKDDSKMEDIETLLQGTQLVDKH